jgi:hypothetical protein
MGNPTDRQIYASIAYLDPDLNFFEGAHRNPSNAHHHIQALLLMIVILLAGVLAFVVLYRHIA